MNDKSEKYLKSIDNTLKDILKELKLQGRRETKTITIKPSTVMTKEQIDLFGKANEALLNNNPFNIEFN